MKQLIQSLYEMADYPLTNKALYARLAEKGFNAEQYGAAGKETHNLFFRRVRWIQQSLKQEGIVTRIDRSEWGVSNNHRIKLRSINCAKGMIAMSTRLGVAIWGDSSLIGKQVIDEPVHLVLSSPPYPLKSPRAYGNPDIDEYIDFLSRVLEPWVANLAKGGSIALNVSNDIFEDKSPARSTYLEELTLALKKRFSLHLMDRLIWTSNKAPGPYQWASKEHYQLNVGYEFVIWLTNDPLACFSDNQQVLQAHSDAHINFVARGGVSQAAAYGDGAYIKQLGAYSNETAGRIPTNVLYFSNYCGSGRRVSRYARQNGLPEHGAKFPESLSRFLVNFLSKPGQLVVDTFGGTLTVGESAEISGRRWICIDMMWEYVRQSFPRFTQFGDDTYWNPAFLNACA